MQERPTNNLLVLALSTFARMEENSYRCPDEPRNRTHDTDNTLIMEKVQGVYQLEPVPRYLQGTVGLDGVLMIKTRETKENKNIKIPCKGDDGTEIQISPENYFREMIARLARPDRPIEICDCELKDGDVATQRDIDAIMDQIRQYSKEHDHVRIFIDLHGGPRANAQLMTAIISLLPMENTNAEGIRINSEDIYSVIFDPRNPENNRICCAGLSYDIMDLVAGVHEFVEYGRTESLKRYAKGCPDIAGIVHAMDMISDALAMAYIKGFNDGLRNLKEEIKRIQERLGTHDTSIENSVPQIDAPEILLRLINQEYGDLIGNKSKQLTKIRWCKNKKFYQLALTMCESQVPRLLAPQGPSQPGIFNLDKAIGEGFGQKRGGTKEEKYLNAFNFFVTSYQIHEGTKETCYYMQYYNNEKCPYYSLTCDNEHSALVTEFLELHGNIKETRNHANHLLQTTSGIKDKGDRTVRIYQSRSELDEAIDRYLEVIPLLRNSGITISLESSQTMPEVQ